MFSGNSFGNLFRITTFGESHGVGLGVVIDGCPAGCALDLNYIQSELNRRRPGQSSLVTQRKEPDEVQLLSGVFESVTTGCPLGFVVYNNDAKSHDYQAIAKLFRPGHADFSYFAKYGVRDYRGGGRSSARETAARVIGGAVAKLLLAKIGVVIRGGVIQVGNVRAIARNWEDVEKNALRSTDAAVVPAMTEVIENARSARDSVGGILEVQAIGVPAGWGEPVFERLEACIAGALMSIPAVKAVEIGEGWKGATSLGSEFNDTLTPDGFTSNNHGGVLGGISTGAPIVARCAIKPTSSIAQPQPTIDEDFTSQQISTKGRHDPCVALRAVVIAEAMLALTLVNFWAEHAARTALGSDLLSAETRDKIARFSRNSNLEF